MSNDNISLGFNRNEFELDKNKVYVLGELLGIEEDGEFLNKEHVIVLLKTEREKNKPLYVWVVFPNTNDTKDLIKKGNKVFIEGSMYTSYSFNDKAVSHTFIVPEEVSEVVEDFEIEKSNEFYLNFTVNNRVILEGKINNDPWREFIPPANNFVTRFSIEYECGKEVRSIYCTLWDTVNDVGDLKRDQLIKVVGSFNLLKKERGLKVVNGVVVEARKNKLDSYVIVVQKITLVGKEVKVEDNKEDKKEK
jgi:hypothetical protein